MDTEAAPIVRVSVKGWHFSEPEVVQGEGFRGRPEYRVTATLLDADGEVIIAPTEVPSPFWPGDGSAGKPFVIKSRGRSLESALSDLDLYKSGCIIKAAMWFHYGH